MKKRNRLTPLETRALISAAEMVLAGPAPEHVTPAEWDALENASEKLKQRVPDSEGDQ